MQRRGKNCHKLGLKQIAINHVSENINTYFKILVVFIVGICIGIVVINRLPEAEKQNINEYIFNSINALKNDTEISRVQILKSSLFKNIVIVFTIWFLGVSFFGGIALYFVTLIIGITFGYTLASIMTCFTFIQGILFLFTTMLPPNIINIPSIIFLIVQGIKSHQNFFSTQKISSKYMLTKYSAYSIIILLLLIIASFVETYISGSLVHYIVKYL